MPMRAVETCTCWRSNCAGERSHHPAVLGRSFLCVIIHVQLLQRFDTTNLDMLATLLQSHRAVCTTAVRWVRRELCV